MLLLLLVGCCAPQPLCLATTDVKPAVSLLPNLLLLLPSLLLLFSCSPLLAAAADGLATGRMRVTSCAATSCRAAASSNKLDAGAPGLLLAWLSAWRLACTRSSMTPAIHPADMATTEPANCPSVAPADMNPNSLAAASGLNVSAHFAQSEEIPTRFITFTHT